ncbi:MAG: MltR family transcriptional regulator [Nitrospiraceae bacterium]|nr:MltR family transcriptional regulator [Nitrospiraceae bacterium]
MDVVAAMDREFHEQPDRVVAIVGAAYLDSTLDSLLRAVLIESREDVDSLLGQNGALGANGARCQLAYCLGLITRDQRDDLKKVAQIRNKFAHDFNVTTFDESPVRDHCASLKNPGQLAAMPAQLFSGDAAKQITEYVKEITPTPREQFRMSVIGLFGSLLRRLHYVRREDHKWFSYDPDALRGPAKK